MIIGIVLTIGLIFMIINIEHPDLKWLIFVVMIQYCSFIVWALVWGLICSLPAKKSGESISKIPDWRVEMVF